MDPCIPADWKEFSIEYRHRAGKYSITVKNPSGVHRGVASTLVDGVPVNGPIPLTADDEDHTVIVTLGPQTPPQRAE
jgi:cellobiose phosphorylase